RGIAHRGRAEQALPGGLLRGRRGQARIVGGPAGLLAAGLVLREGLRDLLARLLEVLVAPLELARARDVEARGVEVARVQRRVDALDGVLAERRGALRAEPPQLADDLRRVARVRIALQQRAVAGERL